eukprot:2339221-Pleurochrysis_carterae.AAC.2
MDSFILLVGLHFKIRASFLLCLEKLGVGLPEIVPMLKYEEYVAGNCAARGAQYAFVAILSLWLSLHDRKSHVDLLFEKAMVFTLLYLLGSTCMPHHAHVLCTKSINPELHRILLLICNHFIHLAVLSEFA